MAGRGASKLWVNKPALQRSGDAYTARSPFLYQRFRNFLEQF
jgi:hypothetical protein